VTANLVGKPLPCPAGGLTAWHRLGSHRVVKVMGSARCRVGLSASKWQSDTAIAQ